MRKIPVALLLLVAGTACVTSTPTDTPGVTNEGSRRMWYDGAAVRVEVYYGMIEDRLGEEQAILRIGIVSKSGPVEVPISGIRLFDPSGRALVPLDQNGFRSVQGRLRTTLDRHAAWWGPSERFTAGRDRCDRWFIYPSLGTGEGFVAARHSYERVYVSGFRVCGGPLVFTVPGGAQPGRWVFQMDLEESTARVPFVVEVPESGD